MKLDGKIMTLDLQLQIRWEWLSELFDKALSNLESQMAAKRVELS